MTHSLFADQGDGRDKIGEEQEKQPVRVWKKAAARPGGRAGTGLRENGAREGIRPLAAVIEAVK
jgi:hypothetical protein